MNSSFILNNQDSNGIQKDENFSSTNPYLLEGINYDNYKEDYYNPIENYYNHNKNDNSLSIFKEKTTQLNSESKTQKSLTKEEEKTLCIDIKNNPDENPDNQINIDKNVSKKKKKKKSDKKCGRKRFRNVENQEEHTKFSDDNLRRKCKHLLIKYLMIFINKSINIAYDGKTGYSIFKKELKIINQKQISNATIKFNKLFLKKKIGEIFSEDISKKYTNLPLNHNKIIINKLINEEDEVKKLFFENLFNLEFIECLEHFIGKRHIPLLEGLKCFNDIKNDEIIERYEEDGEDYCNLLEKYLQDFEEITNNKRPRRLRK